MINMKLSYQANYAACILFIVLQMSRAATGYLHHTSRNFFICQAGVDTAYSLFQSQEFLHKTT
jgi:hypothetical protein